MTHYNTQPITLTIAGSDTSSGAGIQADIKTFAALGVYGSNVITALTAQNTLGIQGIYPINPQFIKKQLESVITDFNIDAIKIGIIGNLATLEVVVEFILNKSLPIVFDPVMQATSGHRLTENAAIKAIKKLLIPHTTIITPNIKEACTLLESHEPQSVPSMIKMAKQLFKLGSQAVLLKGGHFTGEYPDKAIDILYDGKSIHKLIAKRINTKNTHGTGCTLSSAITAYLAKGLTIEDAAKKAKDYITNTIKYADQVAIGRGSGPVHHFYKQVQIPEQYP